MDILAKLKERNTLITLGILLILSLLVLYIRALPLLNLGTTDILNIVGSDDPQYNLRLIELTMNHFPAYSWFEAMTLFPFGEIISWGPLFTWLGATLCLIAGATTRNEIISVALWLPPILAALLVPVTFVLVRKIWDWKAGLFAALFFACIGGQVFFRSLAGYLDHHIAEVLFSTLYAAAYIYAISDARKSPIDLKRWDTLRWPVLLSCVAGIAYVLGYLTMPTMILFAFITAITTIILFVIEYNHGKPAEYIVVVNGVTFSIATIVSFLVGFSSPTFSLPYYTLAHPVAYILLIGGTVILYLLSRFMQGKNKVLYPVLVVILLCAGIGAIALVTPDIFAMFVSNLKLFLGLSPFAVTIQEARPWTLAEAWQVFNFGILLMIGGILILLSKNLKEYRPDHVFVLVWAFFIIVAAFREVRYEYYLAVNIAVLGGICVGASLEYAWPHIVGMGRSVAAREKKAEPQPGPAAEDKGEKGTEKGKKKKTGTDKRAEKKQPKRSSLAKVNYAAVLGAGIICALAVIFVVTSFGMQYAIASSGAIRMNGDWRESLEWMNTHTPETGVDYYEIYDRETFTYPDTAYGVMSWWDYGHLITYIAKRIPNANPFQSGITPNGSAAFFMSQSEAATNAVADARGTRYVMTDIEMATGKFWAMATWYNASVGQGPYQQIFLVPEDPANPRNYVPVTMYTDEYFRTTISRLHNFDGSSTPAGQVYYIEYTTAPQAPYPVITNAQVMDAAQARAAAAQFNQQAPAGYRAAVVSTLIIQSTEAQPALRHYRLVHESPTNVYGGQAQVDLKYVKVFEYVPGARIRGEGMIELPVITNTGRQFVWKAASENGEFIVPYSTEGNPYEVKAAGKYRIIATGREVSVSEQAVMSGALIS